MEDRMQDIVPDGGKRTVDMGVLPALDAKGPGKLRAAIEACPARRAAAGIARIVYRRAKQRALDRRSGGLQFP
jgi:hypothetical protein